MITDAHFAAFILNPSILVCNSNQEKEEGKNWSHKSRIKRRSGVHKRKMWGGGLLWFSHCKWWNSFCKILNGDIISANEIKFIKC